MPSTVHLLTASRIRARKLSSALKTRVATSEPRARMLRSFQVPDANGSSRGVTHSTDGSSGSGSLRLHHQGHYHGVPKWSCGNGPCICSQLFSSLSVFDFHKIWIRTQGLGGCFKGRPDSQASASAERPYMPTEIKQSHGGILGSTVNTSTEPLHLCNEALRVLLRVLPDLMPPPSYLVVVVASWS